MSTSPATGTRSRIGIPAAAKKALKDPHTWVPAAAALMIAVTDTDQEISDWATRHHPLYGSQSGAQDASDNLRTVLAGSAVVTSLVAPGKTDALLPGRAGSLATAGLAAFGTSQATGLLKDSTDRERPNGVDTRSFPSSHTAAASTYATLSAQRVGEMPLGVSERRAWQAGFHTLAAATAWARVEAQAHYPVDVLMGYSLGNFSAVLMQDIFQEQSRSLWLGIDRDRRTDTFMLRLGLTF